MMFGGCSFTWGQGLYYYSNLGTLCEPLPDCYDSKLVKQSHLEYMKLPRYPRLVANHFGTWEVVHPYNSGSNQSIINWWDGAFSDDPSNHLSPGKMYEYSEISHFVFQLTQHQRDNFKFTFNGTNYDIPLHATNHSPHSEIVPAWLESQNLTIQEWEIRYIQENVDRVSAFLKKLEHAGIRTMLFAWPNNYIDVVKKDQWLNDRFMEFSYNNNKYDSVQSMIQDNNDLQIKYDFENFEVPPQDHHPSLKCHQIMAKNVIDFLEK